MYKIDLHTHSAASYDGGLRIADYKHALDKKELDYIAVTDHNNMAQALALKEELGEQIIVGEEIMTTAGEIIGLYLTEPIKPGLSPNDTIGEIKAQGGLVYIPHPFETIRKGIPATLLDELVDYIDIIEVTNGRAFLQKTGPQAVAWARLHTIAQAASSDAHGKHSLGKTYSFVSEIPSRDNLCSLLFTASRYTSFHGVRALLYPKTNRLKKGFW